MNHRLLLTVVWMLSSIGVALGGEIIKPEKPIVLFNGKDLSNFYTWIVDSHREDPDRVFSVVDQVDGAPALRVSGERWGGFVTTEAFRDYRLVVEFRWGPLTWGNRMDRTRDSGILLHCQGPDGNTKKDFNGPWMHSIEYQIIEGGVADFILVGGYDAAGNQKRPEFTASISKDRDGEMVYDPNGTPTRLDRGRVNWSGRDPDWKDVLGFRGKNDVESPFGEWTRAEVICDGNKITSIVNGKVVNSAVDVSLSSGPIMFQSEGAEIFFRKIEIHPLD